MPSHRAVRPADLPASPRALWRAFWRPGVSQLLVGLLVMLLAATMVVTARSRATGDRYDGMRRDDLIALIDSLDTDSARLAGQVDELERTKAELDGGADRQQAAAQEAARRAAALAVLAGTAPAQGPGIRLVVDAPPGRLTPQALIDTVAELRDAGAEVIELDDAHRVVTSTWFATDAGRVIVDGKPLASPLVVEAIGDPHALAEGASFRGGIISRLESAEVGGTVTLARLDHVDVESVVAVAAPSIARPR